MKNSGLLIAIVLVSVACTPDVVRAHEDSLKPLHDKIRKEFTDRCSEEVAKRAHKGKYLSKDFQSFLDNDELVRKMTQVYGDGTGEFAVKVINKKDAILKEFSHERHELNKENTAAAKREARSQVGVGLGVVIAGLAVIMSDHGTGKNAAPAVGISGFLISAGSGILWYLSQQEQEEKKTHIAEITKIEEKWEHNFIALQKKHEDKSK
jgi:hypothetical protein